MSIFDDIGDFVKGVVEFEGANFERMRDQVREDPERLLLGAADPFGTKLWGGITGQDWDPIVNQWGGATEGSFAAAEAEGIDTGPGRAMHAIAQQIASMYAGGYGLDKLKSFASSKGWPPEAVDMGVKMAQQGGGGPTFGGQQQVAAPPPKPIQRKKKKTRRKKAPTKKTSPSFKTNAPAAAKLSRPRQTFKPTMRR